MYISFEFDLAHQFADMIVLYPQIYKCDHRQPRVMALSAMGLNLGVFGSLPTMHAKNKKNPTTNAFMIFAPCGVLRVFVFMLKLQYMQVTYAPDEPRLFWLWEKLKDPQFEPHDGIKMVQVLGSLVYICGFTSELRLSKQMTGTSYNNVTFVATYFENDYNFPIWLPYLGKFFLSFFFKQYKIRVCNNWQSGNTCNFFCGTQISIILNKIRPL